MARPTKPKDLKPKTEGEGEVKDAGAKGGGGMSLDIKFIFTILAIFLCTTLSSVAAVYFITPLVIPAATGAAAPGGEHGAEGEGHGEEAVVEEHKSGGLNLELDEFTVNLKTDAAEGGENTFLRAKMALTISVPPEEDCHKPAGEGEHHAQAAPAYAPVTAQGQAPVAINGNRLLASVNKHNNSHAFSHTAIQTLPSVLAATGGIAGGAAPLHDEELLANGGEAAPSGPGPCLDKFKEKMGQFIPPMRDIINTALMRRTATQLSTPEGVETLKDEVKEQINQILTGEYKITRVNFQDFIIQR